MNKRTIARDKRLKEEKQRGDIATRFKKGNKDYAKAEVVGRPLTFTPDQLAKKFIEYTEHLEANPLQRAEVINSKDGAYLMDVPVKRPWTVMGFYLHIGISSDTFYNYAQNPVFVDIINGIKDSCFQQKLEGAMTGFFKESITARELGLADKSQVENVNINISPTAAEAKEIKKALSKNI